MEEAIWILSPIAVAVLAYLLDVRQARRYELEADAIKERMRAVELAHVSGFANAELQLKLLERTTEHHDRRLDILEGQESGVPKEQADKMQARLDDLGTNVGNIAFAHNVLSAKVDKLTEEEE